MSESSDIASGHADLGAQTGGEVSALLGSAYGMLLGAKLLLVLGLMALAARNRLMFMPARGRFPYAF